MNIWVKRVSLTRKYSKSCFLGLRSDLCLGWLITNCHWSQAKRIFSFHTRKTVNSFCYMSASKIVFSLDMFIGRQRNDDLRFTSQMAWVTFAISLQRKRYLACNFSLFFSETMTFCLKQGVTCFWYTPVGKIMKMHLSVNALGWNCMWQWDTV